MQLFKQITGKYTPEQMNNLFSKAQQMGVPKEVLDNLKKDINTK